MKGSRPRVWFRERWPDLVGYLVVLSVALIVAWLIVEGRSKLVLGGDLHTLRTNNEDYHWGIVRYPQRMDRDIFWMVLVGSVMYPTVAFSHIGHYLIQAFFESTRNFQSFCNISVYQTLLVLTPMYFVARHRRLPVAASVTVAVALLANPFLVRQLLSAPVLPTAALLPLVYLAYLKGWHRVLLVLIIFEGCSYRAGGFILVLFLFAIRNEETESDRHAWRVALAAVAVGGVIQLIAQGGLLFTSYARRIEGELMLLLLDKARSFVVSPLSPENVARVVGVAVWFLAAGIVEASRRLTRWRRLALIAIGGYMFGVTGTLSESQMYFIPMMAVFALEGSKERVPFLTRRGWDTKTVLALFRLGTVATIFLAVPAFHQDLPEGVEQVEEALPEFLTPRAYIERVAHFAPSPHLVRVADRLATLPPARTCCVDPLLMTFMPGQTCRYVFPVGKVTVQEALDQCERVLVDASPVGQRFRTELDAYAGYQAPWRAAFDDLLEAVSASPAFDLEDTGVTGLRMYEKVK